MGFRGIWLILRVFVFLLGPVQDIFSISSIFLRGIGYFLFAFAILIRNKFDQNLISLAY